MLYLITGLMGASKTLNAIKFVNESKQFQGRPVYYFRIRNLNEEMFPTWTEVQKEDLVNWRDYPDGSVFLIDECDHAFPQRGAKQEVPEYIRELKETRSRGMDWIFVTQHPSQMDVFVRRNIGHHMHIERVFGTERSKWFEWDKYQDPQDRRNRSAARTKTVKFDKKYFNAYKSAEYHTHAKSIPYKYLILPVVFLVAAFTFAGFRFLDWGKDDPVQQSFTNAESIDTARSPSTSFLTPKGSQDQPQTAAEYMADRTPRIPDIPWSAPVYDQVYKVESYPRPQCFVWESGRRKGECNCVTQQATPLTISHETCLAIVRQGYFQEFVTDTAIEDKKDTSKRDYQLEQASGPSGSAHQLSAPETSTPYYQPPRSYSTGLATR